MYFELVVKSENEYNGEDKKRKAVVSITPLEVSKDTDKTIMVTNSPSSRRRVLKSELDTLDITDYDWFTCFSVIYTGDRDDYKKFLPKILTKCKEKIKEADTRIQHLNDLIVAMDKCDKDEPKEKESTPKKKKLPKKKVSKKNGK